MSEGYKIFEWQNNQEPALNEDNLQLITDCIATAFISKDATFSDIEDAIQEVHDAGGGSVVFPAGTWEEDGTIDLEGIENVVIKGQGIDLTKIRLPEVGVGQFNIDSDCENIELVNLDIHCFLGGVNNSGDNVKITNCEIRGDNDDGLSISGNNCLIKDCKIISSADAINNSGDNVKITNCEISGASVGTDNTGDNFKMSNCIILGDIFGIGDSSDPSDIADASYYIGNDVTGGIVIQGNAIVADTDSPTYGNLDRDDL